MGLFIHFYIIFGTNLLTGGPSQIAVFCLFQCFAEKEYQTESKWNETFGNVILGTNVIQLTWSGRQETIEEATRQGRAPPPWARPPISWGPRKLLDLHSKLPGSRSSQKSRSRRFHSVWTPFDIPFLRNTEIGKKTAICTGPWVNRLVPKII